jgi:hypothetical protein
LAVWPLEGDLWTWHASLPHGDLLADHGSCETERQAKEHLEDFLKLWLEPFRPVMGATSATALKRLNGWLRKEMGAKREGR